MDQVEKWAIEVIYEGVNITADISPHVVSFTYHDKTEDESDELIIELEDVDALWRNEWYPTKNAKLRARMGPDKNNLMDCGKFVLDTIEVSGPPDTVHLRCVAAIFAKNLRKKKGSSHQSKTLLQIAQYVAQQNGFTIVGSIPNIPIDKATQHRETDLHWLRRLAVEYGVVFSLRGTQLIFTNIFDLEARASVSHIRRTDCTRYKFEDKFSGTYSSAQLLYQNPITKTVVDATYHVEKLTNADGVVYDQLVKDDVLLIHTKTENQTQAQAKVKAALHKANSKQRTGNLKLPGNPLLVSGNNTDALDFGVLSGKYHIISSLHEIQKGQGYTTEIDLKGVGTTPVKQNKIKPAKPAVKVKASVPAKKNQTYCEVLTNKNIAFSNSINAGS